MKKTSGLTDSLRSGNLKLPDGYTIPVHEHSTSFKSLRKGEYRGKKIRIETTYKIAIDGEPLTSHTIVLDDGSVHCHEFPNYSFPSAMDMVRKVIDSQEIFVEPEDELSSTHELGQGGRY